VLLRRALLLVSLITIGLSISIMMTSENTFNGAVDNHKSVHYDGSLSDGVLVRVHALCTACSLCELERVALAFPLVHTHSIFESRCFPVACRRPLASLSCACKRLPPE
jgi:hypothetical protein